MDTNTDTPPPTFEQPPACIEPATLSGRVALELWRTAAKWSSLLALTDEHRHTLIAWCRAALRGDADALTACRIYARVVIAWEDALILLRSNPERGEVWKHEPHDTAELRRLFREAGHVFVGVELQETHDDYVGAWVERNNGARVTSQALGELAVLDQQGGCRLDGWVL